MKNLKKLDASEFKKNGGMQYTRNYHELLKQIFLGLFKIQLRPLNPVHVSHFSLIQVLSSHEIGSINKVI